jgi:hypothetical protein
MINNKKVLLGKKEKNRTDGRYYFYMKYLFDSFFFVLKSSRRNTNASQSGVETEEGTKSNRTKKPKDDETIVKYLLRSMVNKVARRLAPRNRHRIRANTKEAVENTNIVDESQPRAARRGGRRGVRPGNDYFIEQGKKII